MCTEPINYIDTISTLLLAASVLLIFWQIRQTHKWNKKKSAEEALTRLLTGSFMRNIDEIETEYGWSLLTGDKEYESVRNSLNDEQKTGLDNRLTDIFRQLETTTIKIEHKILDEKLCFDYLFSMLTNIVQKSGVFIEMQRSRRKEPRLYEHAERFAKQWEADKLRSRKH